MTHLTSPTLTRGAPSSPPACAGGEDVARRSLILGGASLALGGCFDRPCHDRNPVQKGFLDGLAALARPALASANPLQVEEAVKQSMALAEKIGPFSDWCGTLLRIEGNAQDVAITIDVGRQVSLYAFNDWALALAGSFADFFSTRSRPPAPPGLSDPAIEALKALRLGERVTLSGRMGEIAGSGVFDLSRLLGRGSTENRQFLQTPRFVARIEALAASKKK